MKNPHDEAQPVNPFTRLVAEALAEKALAGNETCAGLFLQTVPNLEAKGLGDIVRDYEVKRRRKMQ